MNLIEKKHVLEELLAQYLIDKGSLNELQEFAWDIIDYFTITIKSDLPPYANFEREFWYAIWQIQHLADEEHEKDGLTKKTFKDALDYLLGVQAIPANCFGTRP